MKLIKTKIDDLLILKPAIYHDNRGFFLESYNEKIINNLLGEIKFIQDNESKSIKGVLRGLHFQKPPFSQAKLVRCIEGEILDVALDLRRGSKTYGLFESTKLSDINKNILFIPRGFAHGFVVMSDFATVAYKVDNYYNPKFEDGIMWNDSDLNIDWKISSDKIIISENDKFLNSFKDFVSPF